jgi:hypothetical protein
MSTNSLSSLNEKPFVSTSFPSTLPTPFEPRSPSSSGPPSATRLRKLHLLLFRTDRTLTRLTTILSTPAGQDTLLATLGYTLQFLHSSLNALLATHLHLLAERILKAVSSSLLPGETLVASLPAPKTATLLARLSTASKNLSDLVADYRIFVRIWGLLAIYQWGRSLVVDRPKDRTLMRITLAQVGVNVVYQVLENVAYLGQHGIIRRSERQQARDWVWSSRFWAAHVLLEFVRLWRVRHLWDKKGVEGTEESEEKEAKIKRKEEVDAWWRELLINACYAPMTVHWSVESGTMSDELVGLLGAIAGGIGLREMWKKSA